MWLWNKAAIWTAIKGSGYELLPFEDCCVFQQERECRLALQAKIQIISTPNIDAASSMIKLGLHKYANKLKSWKSFLV